VEPADATGDGATDDGPAAEVSAVGPVSDDDAGIATPSPSAGEDEPVYGALVGADDGADDHAVAAAPVDMAALFAPEPDDDATAVMPPVAPDAPGTEAPSADDDGTGPVAPASTEHHAG
jgi:hypothetical protein